LKEFAKVGLDPSESKILQFAIPMQELGLWDKDMKYLVEPGKFSIMVGSSSEDIRLWGTIGIR
jgi:beta-glucosidase